MTIGEIFKPGWRQRPEALLVLMSLAMPLAFSTWMALLNNFTVERAAFTGLEIGILQSVREIPGFLAFAVVFILLLMREQTLAFFSLFLLGLGTAITGYLPSFWGLLLTTTIMSVGFHYFEAVRQSLVLQWVPKEKSPAFMGRMIAVGSFAGLVVLGLIWGGYRYGGMAMESIYLLGGGAAMALVVFCWIAFPAFRQPVEQKKSIVLRKRYWLYYALTFMAGARRQIFVVFAGFLMVEKFGFDLAAMALLLLANGIASMLLAPAIGRLIGHWGERRALILEYIGLIGVFVAYAFVEHPWFAAGLYIVDHVFFAMAIAIKTYFQKIADPADMASSAGVSFTINHIAAVFIPALFGMIWLVWPGAVFLIGAGMAFVSLCLAWVIPNNPTPDNIARLFTPQPARAVS
ncbi:MAG: MFS transporter [Magnetovibrionaceae bacterium]